MAHSYAIMTEQSIKTGFVPETDGKQRLDAALAGLLTDLSRERIKTLINGGYLLVEGAICTDPSSKKCAGKSFALTIPVPIEGPARAQDIPLDVTYEDEHLIVINKPAGLVVHPAAGHPDEIGRAHV